jgi:hypothetical protein
MRLLLVPHPAFPSAAITSISVDAGRRTNGILALRFQVEGDLASVAWPEFDGSPDRTDGLWQHSCFEAFAGFVGDVGYCELNFSTSMKWAAYRFDDYRAGMRDIQHVEKYGHWIPGEGRAEMHFVLPDLAAPRDWRLGLSAVIEAKDGSKSYWALSHPDGPPDFHNADCFIAYLPAPDQA